MRPISLLIKPVSGSCNMQCSYCFYHELHQQRHEESWMSYTTIEKIIKKSFEEATLVSLAFQGGEPTLRGVSFYEKVLDYIAQYNHRQIPFQLALQTNGIELDEQWISVLKRGDFLIGISLDGTKEIHDRYRFDKNNHPTYDQVLTTISLLKKEGIVFNVLTVVTQEIAENIDRVYAQYRQLGIENMQFIPCLGEVGKEEAKMSQETFYMYLKTLFDLWYEDMIHQNGCYIRYFDNLACLVAQVTPEACGSLGQCTIQYVCEANGDIYPCDFYVLDDLKLGNIRETSFEGMDRKRKELQFLKNDLSEKCTQCQFWHLCYGGCKRERTSEQRQRYCEALKSFFEYSEEKMKQLILKLQ